MFSIFVAINKGEPKLKQGPFYFEDQSEWSAKTDKGVPNSSIDLTTTEQSRQLDRDLARWHGALRYDHAKSKVWQGYPVPCGTTMPPLALLDNFLGSCMGYKGGL